MLLLGCIATGIYSCGDGALKACTKKLNLRKINEFSDFFFRRNQGVILYGVPKLSQLIRCLEEAAAMSNKMDLFDAPFGLHDWISTSWNTRSNDASISIPPPTRLKQRRGRLPHPSSSGHTEESIPNWDSKVPPDNGDIR